jgi:hypothetical protein
MNFLAILVIALGILTLALGNRLVILGAGVGALLGIGILRFLPGNQESLWWWAIPIGLAVLCMIGAVVFKGFVSLITLAIGAVAGAAIVLAALDLIGLNFGLFDWILALIGAVLGVIVIGRFKDWPFIALAALVGALLTVRGLQMLAPIMQGFVGTLLGLVLAGVSFAYHGGFLGGRKPATQK